MREQIRHCYSSPSGDIPRGVQVGVIAVSALLAPKLRLCFPVPLGDVAAFRAFPASVARINNYDRDTGFLGLVNEELSQLAEAPIVQSLPMLLAGLNPRPDMRQFLQRNTETGAFSSGNDCFRYAVVLMFLEPPLFVAHLPKAAFCCFGADALQDRAPFCIAFPVRFDLGAGILIALAIGCDLDDAHIDTQHPIGSKQTGIIEVAHTGQIPLAANEHQIDLALAVLQQFPLVVAADDGNLLPSGQQPKRNAVVGNEAEDSVVVGLGGMFAELDRRQFLALWKCCLCCLVGVGNLCNAPDGNLGGKFKLLAQLAIERLVHIVLASHAACKRLLGKPVTSLVATLKRRAEHGFLLRRRNQFQVGYEFHSSSMEYLLCNVKH